MTTKFSTLQAAALAGNVQRAFDSFSPASLGGDKTAQLARQLHQAVARCGMGMAVKAVTTNASGPTFLTAHSKYMVGKDGHLYVSGRDAGMLVGVAGCVEAKSAVAALGAPMAKTATAVPRALGSVKDDLAAVASKLHRKPALYVVGPKDTTSSIARFLRVSVPELIAANPTKTVVRLANGAQAFKNLVEKERLNVPMRKAGPGAVGATGDSCSSDADCNGGTCILGYCVGGDSGGVTTPAQAGMSNEGSYCDAGSGPQSGYISNGSCVPLGGSSSGTSSIVGNVVCPGPNMHPDWSNISSWSCICDDGYVGDPNGPGCVAATDANTAQSAILCAMTGGNGTDADCTCPSGYTWDPNNGCVNSAGKSGGIAGGLGGGTGGAGGGSGGGGKTPAGGGGDTTPPIPGADSGISTPWLIGGLVVAAGAVGGASYYIAKKRKKAKGAKKLRRRNPFAYAPSRPPTLPKAPCTRTSSTSPSPSPRSSATSSRSPRRPASASSTTAPCRRSDTPRPSTRTPPPRSINRSTWCRTSSTGSSSTTRISRSQPRRPPIRTTTRRSPSSASTRRTRTP